MKQKKKKLGFSRRLFSKQKTRKLKDETAFKTKITLENGEMWKELSTKLLKA